MPFLQLFAHFVWSTKYREPLLIKPVRNQVFDHILENARSKNILIDSLGGYIDHVHALIALPNTISISKMMQLIKGESSLWVNRKKLTKEKFEWQDEYYAVSVSPSNLDLVRNYIARQEQHHSRKTFQEEIDELMKLCGMQVGGN